MLSRLFFNAGQVLRSVGHAMPTVKRMSSAAGKAGGKAAGVVGKKAVEGTVEAASKFSNLAANVAIHSDDYAHSVGKFMGAIAGEVNITAKGINNIAGKATGGFQSERGNKLLTNTVGKVKGGINKVFETDLKTDYTDTRFFAMLKDSDDSLFFGKKATVFGAGILATGATIMSAKEGIEDKIRRQQGTSYGTASNAPVNTYAYQGASYADNAGATGDLALSLHRQRHSGIL